MADATHCADTRRDLRNRETLGDAVRDDDGTERDTPRTPHYSRRRRPTDTFRRATRTCTGADATRWHVRAGGAGRVAGA